jgi:hypothetical protein
VRPVVLVVVTAFPGDAELSREGLIRLAHANPFRALTAA